MNENEHYGNGKRKLEIVTEEHRKCKMVKREKGKTERERKKAREIRGKWIKEEDKEIRERETIREKGEDEVSS